MFLLMINDSCTICIVSTTKSLTWCWLMTSDRKTRRVYGILLLLLRHSTNCTYPSMNIFTRKAIECVSLYLELTSSSNNRPFYSQIQCVTRDMKAWQIVWISKESTNERSQQMVALDIPLVKIEIWLLLVLFFNRQAFGSFCSLNSKLIQTA